MMTATAVQLSGGPRNAGVTPGGTDISQGQVKQKGHNALPQQQGSEQQYGAAHSEQDGANSASATSSPAYMPAPAPAPVAAPVSYAPIPGYHHQQPTPMTYPVGVSVPAGAMLPHQAPQGQGFVNPSNPQVQPASGAPAAIPNPVLMQQPQAPYSMPLVNGAYHQPLHMAQYMPSPFGSSPMTQPPPQGYQMVRHDSDSKEGPIPSPVGHAYSGHYLVPQQSIQTQGSLVIAPSQHSALSQDYPSVQLPDQRFAGTVKWFNAAKGYGFIRPDNGEEDLFVHQTDIVSSGYRDLMQGARVEYGIEPLTDGRYKAVQVTGPNGQQLQGGIQPRKSKQQEYNGMKSPPAYGGYMQPPYPYPPPQGGRGVAYPPPYYGGFYPYNPIASPQVSQKAGADQVGGKPDEHPMPYHNFGAEKADVANGDATDSARSSGLQIVIHNLAWSCTWQELKDAFSEWNPTRADVAQDNNGRSRGFGIVRFSNKEDAQAAIDTMNNGLVAGRPVTVRLDKYA
eukprot:TRINITY_DN527_c1_g1_i1.p3 TRINITY_DN527_c1_g1~~TRINITY_DN527_c1_g1_i1.p3  ORF type:complete len:508 (-),score=78.89 TRINITY_DN527_c1_g1_i1:4298-5821(-)